MSYELQVQLTKRIYGKASAFMLVRKFRMVYILMAFIALVTFVDLLLLPPVQPVRTVDWLLPASLVLSVLVYPLLQRRFGFGWENYPTVAQPATYKLSEEGLEVTGQSYHTSSRWENFLTVRQIEAALILFFTSNQMFIIPSASFRSDEEREEILTFIRQHIPVGRERTDRRKFVTWVAYFLGGWIAIIVLIYIVLTVFMK